MKKIRKHCYVVTAIQYEAKVKLNLPAFPENYRTEETLKFDWVDGMIGVMPVFNRKDKAEKYMKKHGFPPESLLKMERS